MKLIEIHEVVMASRPRKKYSGPPGFSPENYVGGGESKLIYFNYKIPVLRQLFKDKFANLSLTKDQQFKLWTQNFTQGKYFETMLLSLIWLEQQEVDFLVKNWDQLGLWSHAIDNWAHSDGLCGIYAKLLEQAPGKVLPTFKKWNSENHGNPWLIRISMVSLFYYSRLRRNYPNPSTVEKFLNSYWEHEHYYVQKAIGWTLREYINAYPERGLRFLEKNILSVSSTAFTAAAEKLSAAPKERLKKMRKDKRSRARKL